MDRSLRGLINNKNGALFESEIIGGCMAYNLQERAFIEKTPEPFKVSKPLENGFLKVDLLLNHSQISKERSKTAYL